MTFLELINRVLTRNDFDVIADVSNDYPPQAKQVKDFINDVYFMLLNKNLDWSFREKNGTISLTAGITEYALPADCDLDSIKRIKYADTYEEVTQVSYNDFDRNIYPINAAINVNANSEEDTRPSIVYLFNGKLNVWPTPNTSSTLIFRYQIFPSELSANDDLPIVPEKYHGIIVFGASAMLRDYLDNPSGAATELALYNDGLQTMLNHNRRYLGYQPTAKITIRRRCR